MAFDTQENRKHKRYAVPTDSAEVSIILDGEEHRAIMSDTSADGLGLLLMPGATVEPGRILRLVARDTVHECEIVHIRPDDVFLHVGTRRLADVAMADVKLFRDTRNLFGARQVSVTLMSSAGLLIALGAFAIYGLMSMGVDVLPSRSEEEIAREKTALAMQRPLHERVQDAQKRQEERRRARIAAKANKKRDDGIFSFLTRKSRVTENLVGNRRVNWDDLVTGLGLSASQQSEILDSAEQLMDSSSAPPGAAKARAMKVLTKEQRSKFATLVATAPVR